MDLNPSLEPAEARRVPTLSLLLGYGPMLPFAVAAVAAWVVGEADLPTVARATVIWGGAILCFLSGVWRGLSFRQPGGARLAQIATMLVTFVLGLAALVSPWQVAGLALLFVGFVGLGIVDPIGARHGEAPPFFARLRPMQMAIPAICLPLVILRLVWPLG